MFVCVCLDGSFTLKKKEKSIYMLIAYSSSLRLSNEAAAAASIFPKSKLGHNEHNSFLLFFSEEEPKKKFRGLRSHESKQFRKGSQFWVTQEMKLK